jgi:hypothetical protein
LNRLQQFDTEALPRIVKDCALGEVGLSRVVSPSKCDWCTRGKSIVAAFVESFHRQLKFKAIGLVREGLIAWVKVWIGGGYFLG